MSKSPSVGIYLYGWYNREKWQHNPVRHTPQVGFYVSTELALIDWQVSQIARTGVDFVIFEMVPPEDHSFETIITHIKNTIPFLRKNSIGFTFLIDFGVFVTQPDPLLIYSNLIDYLKQHRLLDDLYVNPMLGKTLFLFSPYPDLVNKILQRTPQELAVVSALWSPVWNNRHNKNWPGEIESLFRRYWLPSKASEQLLSAVLEPYGFFPFWQDTSDIIAMNGIASVLPGYDDLLLERNPQLAPVVPRKNGHTLVEQFRQAKQAGADTLLIYGWNEYFEATTIEPTLEYGDFYLRLTCELIRQTKAQEAVHFPKDFGKPEASPPLYLTSDLERAAQRHADKIPRWDQDDYVADIKIEKPIIFKNNHAVFPEVHITNVGCKPWCIQNDHALIKLGVRLYNAEGCVVREGRADLGQKDILSGEAIKTELRFEILDLCAAKYTAKVDVVWEGKYWFECGLALYFLIDRPCL